MGHATSMLQAKHSTCLYLRVLPWTQTLLRVLFPYPGFHKACTSNLELNDTYGLALTWVCELLQSSPGSRGHWRTHWLENTVSENWIPCLRHHFSGSECLQLFPDCRGPPGCFWQPAEGSFLSVSHPPFSLPSLNLTFAPVSFLMFLILQLSSDSGSLGHILFVWVCLRDHRFLCLRIQGVSVRLGVRAYLWRGQFI